MLRFTAGAGPFTQSTASGWIFGAIDNRCGSLQPLRALSLKGLGRAQARIPCTGGVKAGPCEAARHTLQEAGLLGSIPVRQGDGLAVLQPGEVDTVCIAGMGGQLIAAILAAAPAILQQSGRLVLQPMNAAAELRRWLYAHGWHLVDEALAEADGHIYEIMVAEQGSAALPEPALLEIGPVIWAKKPPLLQAHIQVLLDRANQAAAGMEKSVSAKKSAEYAVVQQRISRLEEKWIW